MTQASARLQTCYRQKCPIRSEDIQRLIFKWIKVDNFKIVDYELYEPFKSYLKEKEKGRDKCHLEEIQVVPRKRSQSCISELSVVRMRRYYNIILQYLRGLYGYDNDLSDKEL